VKNKEPEKNLS